VGAFTPDDPAIEIHGVDLAWPFALDGNGDLATVSGEENTLSALPIRAVTGLGEVPIFPDDGVDLEDMQNGLVTDDERAAARGRMIAQYRREDRIESVTITADDGDEPGDTVFHLDAHMRSGRTASVDVPFGSA
jgi:hypothetical protein